MPRFAANLSMMFNEVAFLERFSAAAQVGFEAVEFLFPYAYAPETVAQALTSAGLKNVLFNLPPGDWEAGERGLAALPGRESEFESSIGTALEYARALGCTRLHAMAGIAPREATRAACEEVYVRNLKVAAKRLEPYGITLLIEPINTRDIPSYFLNRQAQAIAILDAVAQPNAALQMDLYHCQIVEGDLETHVRRNLERIAHFQVAGIPQRHEPDSGEVNYAHLFTLIDSLGYAGWIGCEYRPAATTIEGLGWARPYGVGGP